MRPADAGAPALEHVRCPLCDADDARSMMGWDELGLRDRSRARWRIVRCRACGLVYVDPRHREATTTAAYEDPAYGFARSHLADAIVDGRTHSQRVLGEIASYRPSGTLLDVGCATGDLLVAAREQGWVVRGVEPSPHAAADARARDLAVVTGTLEAASLPSGSADVVTLLDVIEHVADPKALLTEIRRVLRPSGVLAIETPNWRSIYRRLLGRRWAALQPRLHLLYFERATLERALRETGFTPLRVTTEIVGLVSPEGSRRGLGPSWPRGIARDLLVRVLFARPPGRLDRYLLRIGPAAHVERAGPKSSETASRTDPRPADGIVRWMNWPTDRLFTALGMGEQLRIIAAVN